MTINLGRNKFAQQAVNCPASVSLNLGFGGLAQGRIFHLLGIAGSGYLFLRWDFRSLWKGEGGRGNVGLPHQEAVLAFFSGSDLGKSPSRSTSPNYILTGSALGITPSRGLWRALGDHWWVVEMLGHAGLFRKAEDLTLLSQ